MSAPHSTPLTAGEARIATLVHAGLSNPEIARALSLSESTVKNHLNSIYRKGGETGPVNREELKAACAAGALGLGGVQFASRGAAGELGANAAHRGKDAHSLYAAHSNPSFSAADFRYARP